MPGFDIIGLVAAGFGAIGYWAGYRSRTATVQFYHDRLMETATARDTALTELGMLRDKETARLAHCRKAGARGRATQIANAASKQQAAASDAAAAREKTLTEMAGTKMRSRAQVTAPVRAKRTRAKKAAGAGMAAKQGE